MKSGSMRFPQRSHPQRTRLSNERAYGVSLRSLVVLLHLCFLMSYTCLAADEQFHFRNILNGKDVALGPVTAILRDREGYMWFGSAGGLMRYDGYEFREAFDEFVIEGEKRKLSVKQAVHISLDENNMMWVGTRAGAYVYDPRLERATLLPDTENQVPLSKLHVSDILHLDKNTVFLATSLGVAILDKQTMQYTLAGDVYNLPASALPRITTSFLRAAPNIVYVGSDLGLERFDLSKKTYELLKLTPHPNSKLNGSSVNDIVQDRDGILWLATPAGLVRYDPVVNTQRRFTAQGDSNGLHDDDIWQLNFDSTGLMWLATDGAGLVAFNIAEEKFDTYLHHPDRITDLDADVIRTVFVDSNDDIWTGNYPEGIYFADRKSAAMRIYSHEPNNPNSLPHSSVSSILEDEQGNLWLGTDGGGLSFFDRKQGLFTNFKSIADDPTTPSSDAILSILKGRDGLLWCGTWGGGIFSFDPISKIAKRYPFRENTTRNAYFEDRLLHSAAVWNVREGSDGYLWLATHFSGYVRFDRTKELFAHWPNEGYNSATIASNLVWQSLEDSLGNVWLGTVAGLDFFDPRTKSFEHYLSNPKKRFTLSHPSALTIYEDSKNRLWIGTDAGLNLMNRQDKTFRRFTRLHGFTDDSIKALVEDKDGDLWVATNNGITILDPHVFSVTNIKHLAGRMLGGFNLHSAIRTQQNEIILGSFRGIQVFDPEAFKVNDDPIPIALKDLYVAEKKVVPKENSHLLKKSLSFTEEIILDYDVSSFSLEFVAMNYRAPEDNRYAYKLEGFDDDWLEVSRQRRAKYTNLDPGKYTFRVKVKAGSADWAELQNPLTVTQLPPPWKSKYAYFAYAALAISLLALAILRFQNYRNEKERQRRTLEKKVQERLRELLAKQNVLHAMMAQMPFGLLTVDADATIGEVYSKEINSLYGQQNIVKVPSVDLFWGGMGENFADAEAYLSAIKKMLGKDEVQFEQYKNFLPKKQTLLRDGKECIYEIDWFPIVLDGKVAMLMAVVRDSSVSKERIEKIERDQRQLKIFLEILVQPRERFAFFEKTTRVNLKRCLEAFAQNEASIANIEAVRILLKKIRGEAKGLHFNYFISSLDLVLEKLKLVDTKAPDKVNAVSNTAVLELMELFEEYAELNMKLVTRSSGGKASPHKTHI